MTNLNLNPNAMLTEAFSLAYPGIDHVLVATRDGLLKGYAAFNVASAGFGEYRLGDINAGDWIHGLPYNFVEILKTISFFVSLILVILFMSIWLRLRPLNQKESSLAGLVSEISPPRHGGGGPMISRWEEIMRHMDSVKEAEWKFAIIEADKLIEQVLKKSGFPGDTLGERLTLINQDQLQSLNSLWEAHKVRNHIAHDFNYFLRYTEAKRAVDQYRMALKELGAI